MTRSLSIAIPTLDRGEILCTTLQALLPQATTVAEIVIVDQTREHPPEVTAQLSAWSDAKTIHWIRLEQPSIPHAMNVALLTCRSEVVLFLDDDSQPRPGLVEAHRRAYADDGTWAVAGQVLQPGEHPEHFATPHGTSPVPDLEFRFNHDEREWVTNVIACNLSVDRLKALSIGGFDENYIGAAHRFESDFALRVAQAGGRILFEPAASVNHLKLPTGGLRSYGDHRRSASPAHSAGDYYFALHHAPRFWPYALRRLRSNVLTRHLLKHPWLIPSKLAGELRGMAQARSLASRGRTLLAKASS